MKRRGFLSLVLSSPLAPSLSSLPFTSTGGDTDEESWTVTSSWLDKGYMEVRRPDGSLYLKHRYDEYEEWQQVTLNNVDQLSDVDYIADMLKLELTHIMMADPVWRVELENDLMVARVVNRKHTDTYEYYITVYETGETIQGQNDELMEVAIDIAVERVTL